MTQITSPRVTLLPLLLLGATSQAQNAVAVPCSVSSLPSQCSYVTDYQNNVPQRTDFAGIPVTLSGHRWEALYGLYNIASGAYTYNTQQLVLGSAPAPILPATALTEWRLQGSHELTGGAIAKTESGANHVDTLSSRTSSGTAFSSALDGYSSTSLWTQVLKASSSSGVSTVPITLSGVFEGSIRLADDSNSRNAFRSGANPASIYFELSAGRVLSGTPMAPNLGHFGINNNLGYSSNSPPGLDDAGLTVWYGKGVTDSGNGANFAQATATKFARTTTFADGSAQFDVVLPWSVSFDIPANGDFYLAGQLNARSGILQATGLGSTTSWAGFLNTARVDSLSVPTGVTLSSDNGAITLKDGHYVFTSSVPEPRSDAMSLAGLGLVLGWLYRRRMRERGG